jgi:hypothetical protein
VNVVYPDLDNIVLPEIAKVLQINNEEWQSVLKNCRDYILRLSSTFL